MSGVIAIPPQVLERVRAIRADVVLHIAALDELVKAHDGTELARKLDDVHTYLMDAFAVLEALSGKAGTTLLSADSVTPIRPGTESPAPPSADTAEERYELAVNLMIQAVRAAILLIDVDEQPGLAGDVLRLARDRLDQASGEES